MAAVAPAGLAESPINRYYDCLREMRQKMRRYTPFTYIAYKTLVPSNEDDFIGLASKIADFVTLRFLIQFCCQAISPICALIPFIPFVLDICWLSYHWIRGNDIPAPRNEENPEQAKRAHKITSLLFLALGIGGVYCMNRYLPEM